MQYAFDGVWADEDRFYAQLYSATREKKPLVRRRYLPCPPTSDVPIAVTISCKIVQWRATADEDGHYCFAVAL